MTSKHRTIALDTIAVLSLLMISCLGFAHGDEVHVMGTVTNVDASSISVKVADGTVKVVKIMPATKFLKNNLAVTPQELKVGDRVVIHAKPDGDTLNATEVKIGVAGKPTPSSH
jgi:hypothetical protein